MRLAALGHAAFPPKDTATSCKSGGAEGRTSPRVPIGHPALQTLRGGLAQPCVSVTHCPSRTTGLGPSCSCAQSLPLHGSPTRFGWPCPAGPGLLVFGEWCSMWSQQVCWEAADEVACSWPARRAGHMGTITRKHSPSSSAVKVAIPRGGLPPPHALPRQGIRIQHIHESTEIKGKNKNKTKHPLS